MGDGTQIQLIPGKVKLVYQVFEVGRWRVRFFQDNVIYSFRVALGRRRFALVVSKTWQ